MCCPPALRGRMQIAGVLTAAVEAMKPHTDMPGIRQTLASGLPSSSSLCSLSRTSGVSIEGRPRRTGSGGPPLCPTPGRKETSAVTSAPLMLAPAQDRPAHAAASLASPDPAVARPPPLTAAPTAPGTWRRRFAEGHLRPAAQGRARPRGRGWKFLTSSSRSGSRSIVAAFAHARGTLSIARRGVSIALLQRCSQLLGALLFAVLGLSFGLTKAVFGWLLGGASQRGTFSGVAPNGQFRPSSEAARRGLSATCQQDRWSQQPAP
jgi:hypothetical protein